MNLYRLDVIANGTSYPVEDWLGPRLFRSRSRVNECGADIARNEGYNVRLTRIQGAGTMKVMGTFTADSGRFQRA
jgi:hypothetical protein